MTFNLIDKIGEWNPQLFRELKGRLKVFNILIALVISLLTQLGVFIYQFSDFPTKFYSMSGAYCNLKQGYELKYNSVNQAIYQIEQKINAYTSIKNYDLVKVQEFKDKLKPLKAQHSELEKILYQSYCPPEQINMQLWWQDHWQYIYITLSVMFVFTLLVTGTYLLIANLAQEDRRGTLNFIRLSPQSEKSILTGKMLGVPVIIYLMVLAAVPLNLWAGISANIPIGAIFGFYVVLIASCIFFYSNALLFGLISRFFSGFQPWLGSGLVLLFLFITFNTMSYSNGELHHTATWLRLLSPFEMLGYTWPRKNELSLHELQFFYIPVGKSIVGLVGIHILNYGVGIYWAWQAIKRRFRNPEGAAINKFQSYLLVASYQVIFWGFTLQYHKNYVPNYKEYTRYYDVNYQIGQNIFFIVFFNIVLLFGLLAILSPHRQTIQDWARYRHQNSNNYRDIRGEFWLKDWVVDEKSPSLLAMLINLAIATTPIIVWIVIAPVLNIHHNTAINWVNSLGRFKSISGVFLCISLMMIYTTLAQLLLLMKSPRRGLWATGAVVAATILPPVFLGISGITVSNNPEAWLFFNFPWSLENSAMMGVFTSFITNLGVILLLNIQLNKQINLAGESATKALLAGRK